MKKTIAIIAPTGMLGSMVYNVLCNKYNLVLVYRNINNLKKLNTTYGNVKNHKQVHFDLYTLYLDYIKSNNTGNLNSLNSLIGKIGNADMIINCAGINKSQSLKDPLKTFFINGVLAHILSSVYKDKLLHVTTDSVFDGVRNAPYSEKSTKLPNDLYGLSKSLGEPVTSLILRTSFIGPEIIGYYSLLEWVKKNDNKKIHAYRNHIWNGITSREFAKICIKIIEKRSHFPKDGIFHIFSSDISKYDMLLKIRDKYNLDIDIAPTETIPLDRRLTTIYDVCRKLNIPDFDTMLKEL